MSVWEYVVQFNDKYFSGWRESNLVFLSNALAGEVGEFCNDTKHLAGGGTNRRTPSKAKLLEELADVYVYLVLSAEVVGAGEHAFLDYVRRKMNANIDRMEALK